MNAIDPSNGEFKGGVSARLANIEHTLDIIREQLDSIHGRVTGVRETLASTRAHVRVLWGAAAGIGLALAGLAIKVLFTGGAS